MSNDFKMKLAYVELIDLYIYIYSIWATINRSYLQKWIAKIIEEYSACKSFDAGDDRCVIIGIWKERIHIFWPTITIGRWPQSMLSYLHSMDRNVQLNCKICCAMFHFWLICRIGPMRYLSVIFYPARTYWYEIGRERVMDLNWENVRLIYINSLKFIVSVVVMENADINGYDGKNHTGQCYRCEFIHKFDSDVDNRSCCIKCDTSENGKLEFKLRSIEGLHATCLTSKKTTEKVGN